jgi:hypothetical protein
MVLTQRRANRQKGGTMFSKIGELAQRAYRKTSQAAKSVCEFARDKVNAILGTGAATGAATGTAIVATDQTAHASPPTLPDLGVDVGGTITAAAQDLGGIFMTIIAIGIVLCVAWIAWGWRKKIRG